MTMQQAHGDAPQGEQTPAFTLEPERNAAFVGLGGGELALLVSMVGTPASRRVLELLGLHELAADARCQSLAASSLCARGLLKLEDDGRYLPQYAGLAVVYVVRDALNWLAASMLDEDVERNGVIVIECAEGALLLERGQLDSYQLSVVDGSMPMVEMLRELVDTHLALAEDGIVALEAKRVDAADVPTRTLAIRLAEDVDDEAMDAELYDLAVAQFTGPRTPEPIQHHGCDGAILNRGLSKLVLQRTS